MTAEKGEGKLVGIRPDGAQGAKSSGDVRITCQEDVKRWDEEAGKLDPSVRGTIEGQLAAARAAGLKIYPA